MISFTTLINYFIVLGVILLSKSLYFESFGSNILLLPFMCLIYIFYFNKNNLIVSKSLLIFSIFSILIIIANPNYRDISVYTYIVRVFIAFAIVHYITFEKFSEIFIKIIFFISGISLLYIFIIYFNIPSILDNLISLPNSQYRNFIFFAIPVDFINYQIFRNSGLWCEPGAFQIFVNISFIFLIVNNTLNYKKYIFILLIIISIGSTTGFIVFSLLSLVYYKTLYYIKFSLFMKLSIIVLLVVLMALFIPNIIIKFTENSSLLSRYYDLIISINMFTDNIIFGYGFGNQLIYSVNYGENLLGYQLYHSSMGPTGSDGITMLISQIGILSFILLVPFLFPGYCKKLSIFQSILISISLLLMFNTENLTFYLIFIVLTFYGFKESMYKVTKVTKVTK